MSYLDIARVLGGIGIFFFALRFLTGRLNLSISSRFRPFLERLLSNPGQSVLVGVGWAAVLQASSIVVVTTMGLVDSGLIALEQGFFLMLGSTLGTTFKMWFFVGFVEFGPALVAVGSLCLLFARNVITRELLQLVTAVGLAFVGLQMMVESLASLEQHLEFANLMRSFAGATLGQQALLALMGALTTITLQSSSATILMIMGLTGGGVLTVPAAAALVLGANLGTTSTGLIVSLQAAENGKRIALAHLAVKLGGVFITLMLFPSFLTAIEWTTTALLGPVSPELLVAGVHTGFNLISVIWWGLLSTPILKLVQWFYPARESKTLGLSKGVRRMLAQAPKLSLAESKEQFRQLELLSKSLYDLVFRALSKGDGLSAYSSRRVRHERNFEVLKETLHDLAFMTSRAAPDQQRDMLNLVRLVEHYTSLNRTCLGFYDHIEKGFLAQNFEMPPEVAASVSRLRELLDKLWLDVLLPEKSTDLNPPEPVEQSLEEVVLAFNQKVGSGHQPHTTWLLEVAGFMRAIAAELGQIGQLKESGRLVGSLTTDTAGRNLSFAEVREDGSDRQSASWSESARRPRGGSLAPSAAPGDSGDAASGR